jgi:hypothetical protein
MHFRLIASGLIFAVARPSGAAETLATILTAAPTVSGIHWARRLRASIPRRYQAPMLRCRLRPARSRISGCSSPVTGNWPLRLAAAWRSPGPATRMPASMCRCQAAGDREDLPELPGDWSERGVRDQGARRSQGKACVEKPGGIGDRGRCHRDIRGGRFHPRRSREFRPRGRLLRRFGEPKKANSMPR